jgi:hypothetical protein
MSQAAQGSDVQRPMTSGREHHIVTYTAANKLYADIESAIFC